MKRKIGTCAVISFVLSGMGLVSFLFTFFNYCRYGSLKAVPSGGGGYTAQHVFSRGNIPALLYMAVIIALSAVTAARISLAESSAIGIVFNKHRNIFKAVFEHFFCMNIVKAEIICKFNNAIFIYRARCAHTGA